jgi:hypothetical protein
MVIYTDDVRNTFRVKSSTCPISTKVRVKFRIMIRVRVKFRVIFFFKYFIISLTPTLTLTPSPNPNFIPNPNPNLNLNPKSFEQSTASLAISSALTFATTTVVNESTPFSFVYTPTVASQTGDVLVLTLIGYTYSATSMTISSSSQSLFSSQLQVSDYTAYDGARGITITAIFTASSLALSSVTLSVTSSELIVPFYGTLTKTSVTSFAQQRTFGSNSTARNVTILNGIIEKVQGVSLFSYSELIVDNDRLGLELEYKLGLGLVLDIEGIQI